MHENKLKIMKHVGWLMILFFLFMYTIVIYSFIYDGVMLHHLAYKNIFLTCSLLSIGLILGIKNY